ncbi:prolyl oligopeptidase family serine peptidase [Frankia sp. AgB1.9]|uniref:CocE/NonD family hydrolase n=1 Tax=unclassified Frankia TaxID=2632575 RepID=UPI001933C6B7|nr:MULTISPECIES: CocE/NonD family hydrolase [unclassified Frankia]MBL7491735.1 prolyl oligopeptidase family serine peptidase [Frankia sp. AgW1.1]MBL7550822.1 prolyl oligopeptidase family serine peptidase [Frankia sp. AgB1.9]MBL7625143.1 prolyl oligopeptidase family serine peptidase [Frankia sp. AgB1.8]
MTTRLWRAMGVLTASAIAASLAVVLDTAVARADVTPFGHACTAQNGVRFCPTADLGGRVASWDGTPLDVDVTLPATGSGPFPTIVIMHGLGEDKTAFEDTSATGSQALTYHYNTNYYAQRGYAVVTPTARGFGNSCGSAAKTSAGCAAGWVHLDDARYEARDVQQLLGTLVDEGVADPSALGVTGISYGGGTAAQLAFLNNRIELPSGGFAAWTSPAGAPLHIAASYPRWGWADLATALVPNGRATDTAPPSYAADTSPVGVSKLSYTSFLYLITDLLGQVAPAGADPGADLTTWYKTLLAGEPYSGSAVTSLVAALKYKGTTGIPGAPTPMLIENGWTDNLFGAQQGLALFNQARAASPSADVSLQLADTGHPGASNRSDVVDRLVDAGSAFFDAKLRGTGTGPAPGSVALSPMSCPAGSATPAPITAASWGAAHPGTLSFSLTLPQSTTSSGLNYLGQVGQDPVIGILPGTVGDVLTGLVNGTVDPSSLLSILGGGSSQFGSLFSQALQTSNPCATSPALIQPNSIVVIGPALTHADTLAGMPLVTASIQHTGPDGQLDARLWDVSPNGTQILVSRGLYRVTANQSGTISFQLDGNAYTFAAGHRPKLELLSSDGPYARPSNGISTTFALTVTAKLPIVQTTP